MMNWKNTLKKAGLLTSITVMGSVGLVAQTQASIYSRSHLDIDGLLISTSTADQPAATTFDFFTQNTATLNNEPDAIGSDSCNGTAGSHDCGLAPAAVIDASQAIIGASVAGPNDFGYYGPAQAPVGEEFSRSDSVVNSAQLVTNTPSDIEAISESQLQTGAKGSANTSITSTTLLEFTFLLQQGDTLNLTFAGLVNMLVDIDDANAVLATANSVVETQFNLKYQGVDGLGTSQFFQWNPSDAGSCNDTGGAGGAVTCFSTSSAFSMNQVLNVANVPTSGASFSDSGAFVGNFNINQTGYYTLGLSGATKTTVTRRVPEPASLLLLGSGLMGLGFARRRKVAA